MIIWSIYYDGLVIYHDVLVIRFNESGIWWFGDVIIWWYIVIYTYIPVWLSGRALRHAQKVVGSIPEETHTNEMYNLNAIVSRFDKSVC